MRTTLSILGICYCLSTTYSSAQTPGLIFQAATGPGKSVLDPNGDGYVSSSSAGFASNDLTESEIPFNRLPFPESEPSQDVSNGTPCGYSDFVESGSQDPALVYYNGTHLIFRLRLGNALNNAKGYSVLIDSDQKFGFEGIHADPNATVLNPGFEIEISLLTNHGVFVYSVDGGCPSSAEFSYPGTTNYQKSVALTAHCGNPDFFYDFFIPVSDLASMGVTVNTKIRMAVTSQLNAQSAVCNDYLADIAGTGQNNLNPIISHFTPVAIINMNNTIAGRTDCPMINPVYAGYTSVTGTSDEPDGTTIKLYKNSIQIGTGTVSNHIWTVSGISPSLTNNDTIDATATAPGKSESVGGCSLQKVKTLCTAAINQTSTSECSPKKGFHGTAGSAISGSQIKIYDFAGNLMTPTAGSIYNSGTVTVNTDGSWVWKCNAQALCNAGASNCLTAGTYRITQTSSGSCESSAILECAGTSDLSATPSINGTPTTSTNTITGTSTGNAYIFLYSRSGSSMNLLGSTVSNSSGNWSIGTLTLQGCDTLTALAVESGKCPSVYSNDKIVTTGSTDAPLITGSYCTSTVITEVRGLSNEAPGTTIIVYENGNPEGNPCMVDANGRWLANTGISITPGSNITATAQAPCKTVSAPSASIEVKTSVPDALLSITTNLITDGSAVISGTASNGNYVQVQIDGANIGNPVMASGGVWHASGWNTYDIYPGGTISVVSYQAGGCAENALTGPVVQCLLADQGLQVNIPNDSICKGTSTHIQTNSTQSHVVYQLYLNSVPLGNTVAGNGSGITLNTGLINTSGYLAVRAIRIGCSGCDVTLNDSILLTAVQPDPPVINVTWIPVPCVGDTALLESSYPSSIVWSTGVTTQQMMVMQSGNYSVTYTDYLGCQSTSVQHVYFNPLPAVPVISYAGTGNICFGDSLLLSVPYQSGLQYQWRRFGVPVAGADSSVCMVTRSGRYRVRVMDANGCRVFSTPVTITAGPSRPDIFTNDPTTICNGSSTLLQTTPQPNITYQWRKYGNIIPNSSGSQYAATAAGKYTCLATDQYGCTRSSREVEVFVNSTDPVIHAFGSTTLCSGDSLKLQISPLSGYTYQWYQHGQPIPGATGIEYYAKLEGNYKCVATSPAGCPRNSNVVNVMITPAPVSITANGPVTFCLGDSVLLEAPLIDGLSYQWRKYSTNITGAISHRYVAKGTGRYRVRITDSTGCSRNSNYIDVMASCKTEAAFEWQEKDHIKVYPNPSKDHFYVEFPVASGDPQDILITDPLGKKVKAGITRVKDDLFMITGLSPGIYSARFAIMDDHQVIRLAVTR